MRGSRGSRFRAGAFLRLLFRSLSDERLLEGLHQFVNLGFGFATKRGRDGQVIRSVTAEVFDCIAFFDEDCEATVSVAAILGKDAGELGKRAGARVAQGDQGFFLALSETGQSQDGFFVEHCAQVNLALPLGGVGHGGVEGLHWRLASLQVALNAPGKQVPGAVQMIKMIGG